MSASTLSPQTLSPTTDDSSSFISYPSEVQSLSSWEGWGRSGLRAPKTRLEPRREACREGWDQPSGPQGRAAAGEESSREATWAEWQR